MFYSGLLRLGSCTSWLEGDSTSPTSATRLQQVTPLDLTVIAVTLDPRPLLIASLKLWVSGGAKYTSILLSTDEILNLYWCQMYLKFHSIVLLSTSIELGSAHMEQLTLKACIAWLIVFLHVCSFFLSGLYDPFSLEYASWAFAMLRWEL